MNKFRLVIKFSKYLRPYLLKEYILLFLMVLSSLGALVSPYILKILIDDVFPSKDFSFLLRVIIFLVIINILRLIIDFYTEYLYTYIGSNITRDLRKDVFNKVMRLPMSFFSKNKIGDITHRINDEVNAVEGILTGIFIRFVQNIFSLIGLAVALSILNFNLFLISMLVLPIIIYNIRYYQPKIQTNILLEREKYSDILSYLVERISSIKTIKIYNSYPFEISTILEKINSLIKLRLKITIQSSITSNIAAFLIALSPLTVFLLGGKYVLDGIMTVGSLIAFIQYLNRIFNPMNSLIGLYWQLVHSSVSLQRIFEFMEEPTENNENSKEMATINSIVLNNVKFNYDEKEVLKGINMRLNKGFKYAIVGSSGCGKSTIINLLCRFYEPNEGTITMDMIDIKTFDLIKYREKISLVPQDGQFFNDTIYNNIIYGKPNASDKDVMEIFNHLDLDLNNSNQRLTVDSVIGDNATILSGGQKQKIAIARALIKDSEIIIFDEATSALDSKSEKKVIDLLMKNSKDKILIFISHRISTIKKADIIYCMENGKIVESGNYNELKRKNGFYINLFNEQIKH